MERYILTYARQNPRYFIPILASKGSNINSKFNKIKFETQMLERHQYISIDRVTMEGNKQGISLLTILFIAAMTRTNKSGYPEI